MLYVERAAQFGRVDLGRAAARLALSVPALRRCALLPTLEPLLGAALEPRRRRRERQLNQARTAGCLHSGEQTVHQRRLRLTRGSGTRRRVMNSERFFRRSTYGGLASPATNGSS